MNKNLIKVFVSIFVLNLLENVLLLVFFGVDVAVKQTFISILLFTLTLTVILNQLKIVKEGG